MEGLDGGLTARLCGDELRSGSSSTWLAAPPVGPAFRLRLAALAHQLADFFFHHQSDDLHTGLANQFPAGFPSAAISSSRFTARCDSI